MRPDLGLRSAAMVVVAGVLLGWCCREDEVRSGGVENVLAESGSCDAELVSEERL